MVVTCQLCQCFFHSRLLKNDQVYNPRLCVLEQREIHSTDEKCEHFTLTEYFHCDKTSHRLTPGTCHQRKTREMDECRKCKQFEELLAAEALVGAVIPEAPKPASPLKIRAISPPIVEEEEPIRKKVILKKRTHKTILEKL